MSDRSKQDSANRYEIHAHAEAGTSADARKDSSAVDVVGTLNAIARKQGSHGASLRYFGGCLVLGGLVALLFFAPALCPLAFLGFVVTCLPYRVHSFTKRKWVFFLVDYCYFANLAAAAFLVWAPAHAGWEAAAYASVEGPLAGALVAWQCSWVMGSPDHVITVLMHSLPGLALFCHRRLAHTRQPLQLAGELAAALWGPEAAAPPVPGQAGAVATSAAAAAAWGRGGGSTVEAAPAGFGATAWEAAGSRATAAGAGLLRRLVAAADVARGRVPCGAAATAAATTDGAAGPAAGLMACYAMPLPPTACPAPAWLWLAVAPMLFYLAWQLLYFVVVQVCSRRLILARGYDTSYRSLARRAQRSGSALNRLVRSGGVARRLLMFGLLQLLFTLVTLALAVATYHSVEAAVAWQVVKLLLPLYLGAVHACERAPVQELRAAAAQMAAAGLLVAPAAEALRKEVAGKHKVEGKAQDKVD